MCVYASVCISVCVCVCVSGQTNWELTVIQESEQQFERRETLNEEEGEEEEDPE